MIQLSDHFTYGRLLRFTFPSIIMLVFTSIYGVVDGFFVSNFAGKTPFAAVNFIMPLLMMLGCTGFMFGAGGGALIARTLGLGDGKKANELFSLVVFSAAVSGVALALLGFALLRPAAVLMGAEGQLLSDSVAYGRIILLALPFYVLQYEFQCLFATAGKPKLGLYVTAAAGITNMALDALFVALFRWGLEGAAAATALSQLVGGAVPLFYFARPNGSLLRLTACPFDGKALLKTCSNGSSELMSNISGSIVAMLYNFQLLRLAGEDGVAAYGAIMYVNFIFLAIFIGYAIGSAPVISYHYGAGHSEELHSLLVKSAVLTEGVGMAMMVLAFLASGPLAKIFVGYDRDLYELTVQGFHLYAVSYLLCGCNIFGSSFFTALNNGLASALISFLRTMVFQCAAVLILPVFLEVDGIWLAVAVAETLTLLVTLALLAKYRKIYRY